mmetsp:Transcript_44057/g.137166  ORF Transcript_44057/g.137166 Transcript_44057/m.137166 type:complete len:361 (-) Transcript_44057:7-1089(-)
MQGTGRPPCWSRAAQRRARLCRTAIRWSLCRSLEVRAACGLSLAVQSSTSAPCLKTRRQGCGLQVESWGLAERPDESESATLDAALPFLHHGTRARGHNAFPVAEPACVSSRPPLLQEAAAAPPADLAGEEAALQDAEEAVVQELLKGTAASAAWSTSEREDFDTLNTDTMGCDTLLRERGKSGAQARTDPEGSASEPRTPGLVEAQSSGSTAERKDGKEVVTTWNQGCEAKKEAPARERDAAGRRLSLTPAYSPSSDEELQHAAAGDQLLMSAAASAEGDLADATALKAERDATHTMQEEKEDVDCTGTWLDFQALGRVAASSRRLSRTAADLLDVVPGPPPMSWPAEVSAGQRTAAEA